MVEDKLYRVQTFIEVDGQSVPDWVFRSIDRLGTLLSTSTTTRDGQRFEVSVTLRTPGVAVAVRDVIRALELAAEVVTDEDRRRVFRRLVVVPVEP